jgi:hypothetical protein
MFSFKSLFRIFSHEPVKVLGRWQIDYCSVALHRKVLLNNEDHCGPCGSTGLEKEYMWSRVESGDNVATRVESGDALPKGESLTVQPAELVGRNKFHHFQSLVASPDLKYDTIHRSPTAKAVGDSHNLSSFSSLVATLSISGFPIRLENDNNRVNLQPPWRLENHNICHHSRLMGSKDWPLHEL